MEQQASTAFELRETERDRRTVLRSMDQCTKCGICHAHCPVAAVTGEFPGPMYSGPQAQRFRVIKSGFEISPMLCSGCGVCTSVCPNNVAISDIIALAKSEIMEKGRGVQLGQRLLNRPELIGWLGGVFPRLTNNLLGISVLRGIIEWLLDIHREAPLPKVYGRQFKRWFIRHTQPEGPVVSYFTGCAIDNYDPDVGIAMVRLLNYLGYRVDVPTDLCCSLPMLSSGETTPARARARVLVDALHSSALEGRKIISTSTSCSLTLRSKYATCLDMTDVGCRDVANAVVDACEFLLDRHVRQLCESLKPLPLRVLYHAPCQLRGHRMGTPAVELLRLIPGIELELSQADCCGIGGTYGYHKNNYDIAMSIGKMLVDQVRRFKPDVIVCDSETCRWNIVARTSIESIHPVQLLMRALGKKSD
ncbi:anaerobic glycerol-3-phosphate dehydrogenase subunit C [Candidatus Spongiihabitans sp.]|uniref:anaerobic glycerol-3-phosphate dehydrogenase subunit C n=1 Tax=Candidatus Spongiihabitans sp. TaxID=3101308 RepID=UPI003C7E372B